MKKVQISRELFLNLIRYHFAEMYELEEDIKNELENKLNLYIEDAIKIRKQAEEKYFGTWSYENSMSMDTQIKEI